MNNSIKVTPKTLAKLLRDECSKIDDECLGCDWGRCSKLVNTLPEDWQFDDDPQYARSTEKGGPMTTSFFSGGEKVAEYTTTDRCPFCGGDADVKEVETWNGTQYAIVCNVCGAQGKAYSNEGGKVETGAVIEKAVKAWNLRK